MPEPKAARRRVFFALWPDDAARLELVRATRAIVRRSGGRATPTENLHITLAFLGPITEADLERVRRLPPLPSPEFEIIFDRLGFWKGSRALWVGPSELPAPLIELEAKLWDELVGVGFERERRPFRPHVTVARKARRVDEGISAVAWRVSELALVESKPGARHPVYEALDAWPFESGP